MKEQYKIVVRYDPPPITTRSFDWRAVEDDYEPGMPMGFGWSYKTAIIDLLEQLDNE
jgi:hypothetical protein